MERSPQNIPKLEEVKIEENKTEKPQIKEGVDFVFEQNPELSSIGTKEQYSKYLETIFPESKIKGIVYHGTNNKIENDKFDISRAGENLGLAAKAIYFSKDLSETFYGDVKVAAKVNVTGEGLTNEGKISDSLLNQIKKVFLDENKVPLVYTVHELTDFINNHYKNDSGSFKASNDIKFDNFLSSDFNKSGKKLEDYLIGLGVTGRLVNDTMVNILIEDQIYILGSKHDSEEFKKFIENNSN